MKEFSVDLVIDKTFNVFAETEQEAKELAIQKARQALGSYNSLEIDDVYETFNGQIDIDEVDTWENEEELEFEKEYEAYCYDEKGICVHCYVVEADHWDGARDAARDFYMSDFPNRPLLRISLVCDKEEYNYYEIQLG